MKIENIMQVPGVKFIFFVLICIMINNFPIFLYFKRNLQICVKILFKAFKVQGLCKNNCLGMRSFSNIKWSNVVIHSSQFHQMLGKEYPILEIVDKDIIAIPSPDGSQDGKWYFSKSVFTQKKQCGV